MVAARESRGTLSIMNGATAGAVRGGTVVELSLEVVAVYPMNLVNKAI